MTPAAIINETYIYEVASCTYKNVSYDLTVNAAGHVESCTCPDHIYRHRACKHMKALQAQINEQFAAEEAAAVAEVEAMIAEQARIEKAARFEAVKAEIAAIDAKYAAVAEAEKIVAEPIETPAEQQASGKFHAGMFVGSRGCSVYVSDAEMAELKARVAARKAHKAANMAIGRGFVVQQIPELNGRMVPMKHAA